MEDMSGLVRAAPFPPHIWVGYETCHTIRTIGVRFGGSNWVTFFCPLTVCGLSLQMLVGGPVSDTLRVYMQD